MPVLVLALGIHGSRAVHVGIDSSDRIDEAALEEWVGEHHTACAQDHRLHDKSAELVTLLAQMPQLCIKVRTVTTPVCPTSFEVKDLFERVESARLANSFVQRLGRLNDPLTIAKLDLREV